ncbi:LysM peptidoglycan-binding domain-containing protein [Paenalcaligenes niemegkensis]|uniref:LysM peptidoglycan-binding domain-containing protein n=1 Tax=Paenalcaligenes niemegkensis TaxID=2895469 RepID=UPI0027E277DC|nr:LysM peptidoglycan-binding domain-containing protein [Paenalcaligenes niemegkensis]
MLTLSTTVSFLRRISVMSLIVILAACGTTKSVPEGQYRVQKGDTLTKIARQHGQSVSALMSMNSIRNPNQIKAGQVLKVKGGASSTAAPAGGRQYRSFACATGFVSFGGRAT